MKFLIMLLFLGSWAFAQKDGGRVGNGGDAVVCYSNSNKTQIASLDLLDYWEKQDIQKVDFGSDTFTVEKNIQIFIERLAAVDPKLAQSTRVIAESLAANIPSFLKKQSDIPEIEDAHPENIPSAPNCFIEQFAIQWKDLLTDDRRFYISERLYNHSETGNRTRAGLILHEALYRQALLNGAQNSDGVRKFNYAVAAGLLKKNNLKNYYQLLVSADLNLQNCYPEMMNGSDYIYFSAREFPPNVNCFNGQVQLNSEIKVDYDDGAINRYSLLGETPYYTFSDVTLNRASSGGVRAFVKMNGDMLNVNSSSNTDLGLFKIQVGVSSNLRCQADVTYNLAKRLVKGCDIMPQSAQFPGYDLHLSNRVDRDEKQNLKTTLSFDQTLHIMKTTKSVQVLGGASVLLNADGELVQGHLSEPFKFMWENKEFSTDFISLDSSSFILMTYQESLFKYKNQARILNIENYDYMSFCKESSDLFNGINLKSDSDYISKPEYFYNPITQGLVYKSDETVDFIDQITCYASQAIQLKELL